MINYPTSIELLVDVLKAGVDYFEKAQNGDVESSELHTQIRQCCWSIILASEFIKKNQEDRKKFKDAKLYIDCDIILCSLIFYLSQLPGVENESNMNRSLMIFFKAFTESFFLDCNTDHETTIILCTCKLNFTNIYIAITEQCKLGDSPPIVIILQFVS
jgi:hypothetical protein